ncbi:unknown [Cercopithecine alphaherpesvirus 9]|uniref:Envelope protein UL20 n=1 Tax=Cercopithecine herpesvirus 9 (strain DHV) TaxID=36348 RepID=Q9E1Y0_CHV9D|nr:envelope protein UL20 [Cercopithecine alphaherpesvirus 9]AAG27213.1 unknown [Cercopithecine alphaherpesvirus 9]
MLVDMKCQLKNEESGSTHNLPLLNTLVMLSYSDNMDVLVTSEDSTSTLERASFSKHTIFYIISALFIQPVCCLVFYYYYKISGFSLLLFVGIALTLIHYFRLAIMFICVYRNVRNDLLPLSTSQQLLLGFVVSIRTISYIVTAHHVIFVEPTAFFYLTGYLQSGVTIFPKMITKLFPVTWGPNPVTLLVVCVVIYTIDCIADMVSFIGPRIWVRALMRANISF